MAHHEHTHSNSVKQLNNAFIAGIALNVVYIIVQMGAGIRIHSLSLISDAGHNIADVASLLLSLIGFQLTKVKPNNRFTYGYRKTSVLIALVNSVVLLISIGIIGIEAVKRIFHPAPLPGKTIAVIAVIGIFVNGLSAFFFFRDKDNDLNVKSAFLHLLADAAISAGVVAGGIFMYFTHLYWIDAALSIVIAFVIVITTWKLLSDSMKLSLDAVPENVDIDDIKARVSTIDGIVNIHHLHIWAISTTENALTAHLLLADHITAGEEHIIKSAVRGMLAEQNIHHITLETERQTNSCEGNECKTSF
jgi:cobalt-zinc-cadmium efflux system protein